VDLCVEVDVVASRTWRSLKKDLVGYAFIAPAVLAFAVFLVYPSIEAIRISFYKITPTQVAFVGLQNYAGLLKDQVFGIALANTFKYVLFIVPITLAFSLFVSVLVSSKSERVTSFYRGVFYIPAVASVVSVSLVWSWIFNPVIGIANYLLSLFHLPPVNWLAMPGIAFYCVVLVIITWTVGRPIIVYTAALGGIPKYYYEAAEIDGASKVRQFFSITLPLLAPTTLYVIVITTINAFQTFAAINLLTSGGPSKTTTSVIYELYQQAFRYNNFSYASAMGVVLFLMVGIVAFFQFRYLARDVEY